ncbi:MAG: putative collagen-binding domain-containing protein [Pirellulaceae bacterium]
MPPDAGYAGHDGFAEQGGKQYNRHDIRKLCLWGTLLAGGGGVEYYFGYKHPQNDLVCEDFRSRDKLWDDARIALAFFREHKIPFWTMTSADALVGNAKSDNSRYCFAKPGEVYLVYLPQGGTAELDLAGEDGTYNVEWFNPRTGGGLTRGSVSEIRGGGKPSLGAPPAEAQDDWLIVVHR